MAQFETRIDNQSAEFEQNRVAMQAAVDDLHDKLTQIYRGGGRTSAQETPRPG